MTFGNNLNNLGFFIDFHEGNYMINDTNIYNPPPPPVQQPSLTNEPDVPQDSGVKVGVIGAIINFVVAIIMFNTANLNVLVSGAYLALSKSSGKNTVRVFYLLTVILEIVREGFIDGEFLRLSRAQDPFRVVFSTVVSSIILAAIPLGVRWIVLKIRKKS